MRGRLGVAVRIDILVTADDAVDAARELYSWLHSEDGLRGKVRLEADEPPPGTMGTADVVAVAVGAGGAGTVLARAVLAWMGQRTSDVALKLRRPDGVELELGARRTSDPEALLRLAREFLSDQDPGRGGDGSGDEAA